MFGGLQIKGASASKDADDEPAPTPETSFPAAPAAAMSSFGFINAGAPELAPTAAAPEVSSFSFLNPAAPEPVPSSATPASPAAATSGFSFMVQESTTPTIKAAAENPVPTASAGFDFMHLMGTPGVSETTTPAAAVEETAIPTISEETPAAPAVQSGFSFLSTATPAVPLEGSRAVAPPNTIHSRTNSVSSASSALSAPSLPPVPAPNPMPTQTGGLIAGAGVSFGTSSAKPRIKKKKSRASKIGIGANHSDTITTATSPAPAVPTPSVVPDDNKSPRNAALEATNRAEAFMQAKAIDEAKASIKTTSKTTSSAAALSTETVPDYEIRPTESTDEVLTAAKEAAEQAKILQHQQKGKGGGFMGTFFKGFRPSSTSMTSSGSMGNSSKHSVGSQSVGSNSSANAIDRLAKEQQAMKQAMAKRQLEQHREQKQSTISQSVEEDNDDAVVSTSVGSYTPTAPEPMEYKPVTATADAVAKSTISEGSTFAPASIPTQKSAFGFDVPLYGAPQQSVQASVAPTVKLNNTPKDKFEHHQDYFSESVNRAMKRVEDARNLKNGLLEERFVALAKDRFAVREIEQIEELLQASIDEEDYEQADELGQKLDSHKREKSEVESMLANNKKALEKLESESKSLGELVISCFEDLALRLEDLKKTELAGEKKDDNETLTQYASISKQLSAEHERLQQDLKHLERDEQLVGEERKELEDSIKDQTGEIEIQKDEASSKLTEVEQEIEELRKAVQMKQKEAADLRTKMFGFEDSISKVRVKFSRQLTRVDKKEISLKESRNEWEIENEQHKRQNDAHDLQVKTHSDTLLAREELMDILDSELRLSKEFSEIIPTQLGFMEDKSESEGKDGDDEGSLAQLKANVVKCEGAIGVAKKTLKMASMEIQNLQNERGVLEVRIPELETQKKLAAAGRDFKAAGKFSKEIKDATARIKKCEEDLDGDAKIKKAFAEENLRQLDLELLEAKEVADAMEKCSGKKRMEILAKKISQLVKEKVIKCGESRSDEKNVKSVAARVLDGQIMILKGEGFELGSKYGGWGELMKSIDLDDGSQYLVGKVDEIDQEGEGKPGARLTSEERLEKAKELLAKCSVIEGKVLDAAERENFEAAGELQEILDKINAEIEELNITDEECLMLAQADTTVDTAPSEQQNQGREDEEKYGLIDEERFEKAKELMTKQSELEQKVEEAVEKDDFDAAEDLQTSIDHISAELMELNITDEERHLFTAEGGSTDVVPPTQEGAEATEGDSADAVSPAQEDAEAREGDSADVVSPAQEDAEAIKGDSADVVSAAQEDAEATATATATATVTATVTVTVGEEEEEKKDIDEENTSDLDDEKLANGKDSSAEKEDTRDIENEDIQPTLNEEAE